MAKVKQITAWVENQPGQLGRVSGALAEAKISITTVSAYPAGTEAAIRLLVSDPMKARRVLQESGIRVTEEEVLLLTVPDKQGQLAKIAQGLGEAGINVDFIYATASEKGKKENIVLGVSDVTGAAKALHGI